MNHVNLLLINRGILKLAKQPAAPLMGFAMSLFFLIVYNAGIGGIGFLEEFGQSGYIAFIFPLTIVSLAMGSSAGAGQTLHADMQSGYFKRLFLSPVSKYILVISPMIADVLSSLIFTGILLGIGFIFGVPFNFGFWSVLGILLISLLWTISLCGFTVGIMLRTGQPQSASIITNAVFPLLFLSTTFLPSELIKAKWLLIVSKVNPVTYLLEACRFLLAGTSSVNHLLATLIIFSIIALISIIFAITSADKIRV